jgi:kynurenine formamidase
MDYLFLRLHGTATHVDALGHVWAGERLYNGHPSSGSGSGGLHHCGIDRVTAIVTRGVLLDVAGHQDVDHLPPGHEITVDELRACARDHSVEVRQGDAVLVRTGWPRVYASDPDLYTWEFPGIGLEAAEWLAELDVVLVGADNLGVEVRSREKPWELPVHLCLLHRNGIYMLELLDLDRIAADGVRTFLFFLAPLTVVGGTGSPVNPIAIA